MFKKIVMTGIVVIFSITITGCTFIDNVKYNFIEGDVPETEVVLLKSDVNLTIAQKQTVIESIIGNDCFTKHSYVDFMTPNGRLHGTVKFSECIQATDDGYTINYYSKSNISKKAAMHFADYEELGFRVADAKLKIEQLYPEKSKMFKSTKTNN